MTTYVVHILRDEHRVGQLRFEPGSDGVVRGAPDFSSAPAGYQAAIETAAQSQFSIRTGYGLFEPPYDVGDWFDLTALMTVVALSGDWTYEWVNEPSNEELGIEPLPEGAIA